MAIITVFIDTFVVLTCTALVIIMKVDLTNKAYMDSLPGIALTQEAFKLALGSMGGIFIAVCLFFFALSTIIGWYYFGVANVKYLWKQSYEYLQNNCCMFYTFRFYGKS